MSVTGIRVWSEQSVQASQPGSHTPSDIYHLLPHLTFTRQYQQLTSI